MLESNIQGIISLVFSFSLGQVEVEGYVWQAIRNGSRDETGIVLAVWSWLWLLSRGLIIKERGKGCVVEILTKGIYIYIYPSIYIIPPPPYPQIIYIVFIPPTNGAENVGRIVQISLPRADEFLKVLICIFKIGTGTLDGTLDGW